MARRIPVQDPEMPLFESEAPESRPAPKARQAPAAKAPRFSTPKIVAAAVGFALLLGLSLAAYYFVERFFLRDPRFTLYGSAATTPSFHVQGIKYASKREIEEVFADDLGRSVYSVPLEDRRHHVRAVDWVREASVARLWPNRLLVHIVEREPVAFITLPSSRTGLIDADGAVMTQPQGRFDLPLLKGVEARDPLETRRAGVARLVRIVEELGEDAREISEIDVADPANTVVAVEREGRILRLQLGDSDFALRFAKFQENYARIRQHMPGVTVLDLRLDKSITGAEQ